MGKWTIFVGCEHAWLVEKDVQMVSDTDVEVKYSLTVNLVLSSINIITGALSGPRQFLATETPLKMMRNAFYFTSKALFFLKIFKFLS